VAWPVEKKIPRMKPMPGLLKKPDLRVVNILPSNEEDIWINNGYQTMEEWRELVHLRWGL